MVGMGTGGAGLAANMRAIDPLRDFGSDATRFKAFLAKGPKRAETYLGQARVRRVFAVGRNG